MKRNSGSGRNDRPVEPRGWRIAFLLLCTIAACLSADLERLHVNVHTDPDYQSYCAMSERVNCETVAATDYAVFLGLPVAIWGLAAYLAMGGLAIWGLRSKALRVPSWPFGILFWAGAVASVVGVALFALSHFVIESICVVCFGTYWIDLGLLGTAAMALRRVGRGPIRALAEELRSIAGRPAAPLAYAGLFAAALLVVWVAVPAYWKIEITTGPGGLAVGVTSDGHPWIGARQPALEIVEFSDYQCPHCMRGHTEMRELVTAHPDEVRLIHRSFPLDQHCNSAVKRPFHVLACRYAEMAFCAGQQRRFWEANDYLFAEGRRRQQVTAQELADAIGLDAAQLRRCLDGSKGKQAVEADLAAGQRLGVRGTPTFVIDGRLYPGRVPVPVVEEALSRSSPPGPSGRQTGTPGVAEDKGPAPRPGPR